MMAVVNAMWTTNQDRNSCDVGQGQRSRERQRRSRGEYYASGNVT